jgi:site-specific recombinase XerD
MDNPYSAPRPTAPDGSASSEEEPRVREVWNGFRDWMRHDKGYSITTVHHYTWRAQNAHRWLRQQGHQGLPWATTETLRAYWDTVTPSAANRNDARSALVAFFHFVNHAGWRPDNPALPLPRVKTPKRLPRPVTNDEARKILDMAEAMGPQIAAMVNLLAYCGLRNSELRSLRWSDVEGPWLRVVGKGDKERSIPIPPPAMLPLVRWRKQSTAAEWVFPSSRSDDRPIAKSTLSLIMVEIADAACVEVTAHKLRHTYATRLLEVCSDLRAVQEAMGHSRPETTALYTKVNPKRLAEAADEMTYGHMVPFLIAAPHLLHVLSRLR